MRATIQNTNYGYIVAVYFDLHRNGNYQWHRLRNFGDRQGDAIEFRDYDVPKLEDSQVRLLIKNFDINRKYQRVNGRKFKVQSES